MTGLTVPHSDQICDRSVNKIIAKNINFSKLKVATPGAILEISLWKGVSLLDVTPQNIFWPTFSVYTHEESSGLFKELYQNLKSSR